MGRRVIVDEQNFQKKLADLMSEISTLPRSEREKIQHLAEETEQRHEKLRQNVGSLQESLNHLRLSIKYMVFDLEATRRENQYLRRMLERQSQDLTDDSGDDFNPTDESF
jgi:predicted enzyme involved in methoxymalonyl-ACP biosynthesis